MSSNLESAHIALSPADASSGPFLQAVFASLWRRRVLSAGIVCIALALGVAAVFVMPARYTAQAYVRGEFFAAPETVAKDDQSTTAAAMNLDLVRVIETQSRLLLESNLLVRRVVEQLGLERLQPVINQHRFWPAFGSATKNPEDEVNIAAARLLRSLSVTSDPNAYLLAIQFRAGDPELAELITNAFVAELLRSARLQTLSRQRSMAQAALTIQLAKFGDKHPGVVQARMRFAATDELLKAQLDQGEEAILQAAGENVTRATSDPSSSAAFVIGLLLLLGVAISIGIALWLERARWVVMLEPSFRTTPSH
jgi:uncharacterized protein involved in exopolysaccharide biosynthesis